MSLGSRRDHPLDLPVDPMPLLDIRFISSNPHKVEEARFLLARANVNVLPVSLKLDELQTEDPRLLVKTKLLTAFRQVGRPLFVEHTGLYLTHLNGLPGGLTQMFWDRLQAERFAELFGNTSDPTTIAKTFVGYADGRSCHFFEGEIKGRIAPAPDGPREFQWDCVFIPDGHSQTFARMGALKHEISMRRLALDSFATYLQKGGAV